MGLELHEAVVGGSPAVHAQLFYRIARVTTHGVEQVGYLVRNALYCRAGNMPSGCAAGDSKNGSASVGIPVGCAQANECRDEIDAPVVGHRFREGFDFL